MTFTLSNTAKNNEANDGLYNQNPAINPLKTFNFALKTFNFDQYLSRHLLDSIDSPAFYPCLHRFVGSTSLKSACPELGCSASTPILPSSYVGGCFSWEVFFFLRKNSIPGSELNLDLPNHTVDG